MSYCNYAKGHPIHGPYHDNEYGFPIDEDNALPHFDLYRVDDRA